MVSPDGASELSVTTRNSTRPAPDTIGLSGSQSGQYAELILEDANGKARFFLSLTGQFTVTASSAQSMEGTVSFHGREEFGTAEVDVTAKFNALCLPNGVATC